MYDVCVIAKPGTRLMPTSRVRARKLLRVGKAVIVNYMPFAIQLTYDLSKPNVQEIEVCVDTGSEHIGISVKSKKHEYVHLQADNLSNEKERHEAQVSYRRARRNRKRYRAPRFNNRRIPEGWLAPNVRHKKDNHLQLLRKITSFFPVIRIVAEVGQFDPALMRAKDKGETLEGVDYQHGPTFGLANKREAVFVRDNYTCQVCGKSLKDKAILTTHHNIHRSKGGSDSVDNLVTVCTKCHTPKNHQPCKPLETGAFGKLPSLKDATYMNIVRWILIDELKELFSGIDIRITYGSYTKEARRRLGQLAKSHANDAYAMGDFHPKHRHQETHIRKRRRNNRVLSKFYDAKYLDIRDGKVKSGKELSCNRTNRRELRNGPNNERVYRGYKVLKGRVSTRTKRYHIQSGDVVIHRGKTSVAQGVHCNGIRVVLDTGKSVKISDLHITKKIVGWQFLSAL